MTLSGYNLKKHQRDLVHFELWLKTLFLSHFELCLTTLLLSLCDFWPNCHANGFTYYI